MVITEWCWKCGEQTPQLVLEHHYVSESFSLALLECSHCGSHNKRIVNKKLGGKDENQD